jgi:hypothetical protein
MVYRRRARPRRPPQKMVRRNLRRRAARRKVIPRGLRPAIIPIQRDITMFVNTDAPEVDGSNLPTNWAYGTSGSHYNTVQCTQMFSLNMLANPDEFTSLFRAYKLNCVVVTITSLHNTSNFTAGSAQNYYGGNLIVYAEKNTQGIPLDTAIDQDYWDEIPSKKTMLLTGNRAKTFRVYPRILSATYVNPSTSMTVTRRPSWISTASNGLDVPHYGLNMQFSYTDPNLAFKRVGQSTAAAPLNFRINYKFLMQLKHIQ